MAKSAEPTGNTILGARLENPYRLSVMQQAKQNLVTAGVPGASTINVRTTKKYVRFLPKNKEERDALELLDLTLFDIPLDYEIISGGTSYHDPSIPDSLPTPEYTVVDPNFSYSVVPWELLDNAYIPEDDPQLARDSVLVDALIVEAFTITNNLNMLDVAKGLLPSRWRPAGTIRVWDDVLNDYTPVRNCRVITRRFLKFGEGITDSQGDYSCNYRYRYNVHYSIRWEDKFQFRICDNFNLTTAKYDGPYKKDDWDLDIGSATSTNKSMRFATMYRAANRYFNENCGGLDNASILLLTTDMTYKHSEGGGINVGHLPYLIFSNIRVWGKNENGDFYPTEDIFSTTIHELAHSTHSKKVGGIINLAQVSPQIRESWASAIEWWITRLEYYELGISYQIFDLSTQNPTMRGFRNWDQYWNGSSESDLVYTPLFIDLVDNLNQSTSSGSPSFANTPSDPCPGPPYFDNANCLVGSAPNGTTAFIYNENFYYTPIGCCTCPLPGSSFDNANCWVQTIPSDRIGFVYNNNWYLFPLGDPTLPYDVISGFTMSQIENEIIPYAYGLSSASDAIKNNRPPGVTLKQVDKYLEFYFAL